MYELDSCVRYSEVDSETRMKSVAILDYFQDCCSAQSEELGIGVEYLLAHKQAWVLSSIQVQFKNAAKFMDKIKVQTWPYGMKSFYGYRNFKMVKDNGDIVAIANSIWVLMDLEAGRPLKVPSEISDKYELEPQIEMECSDRKLTLPKEYEELEAFVVPEYFIDTNMHMNNSKYVLAAMEYLPEDFQVQELRVEYKKSAMVNDIMIPRVTVEEDAITVALMSEDEKPFAIVKFIRFYN